jgi:hypothetical protein
MIRQATKYDKIEIVEMLRLFRNESQIEQYKNLDNVEYINGLLDQIIAGRGVAFIKPNAGMILGFIGPVVWCNKTLAMYELAWYVRQEFRQGTTGYRLVQAYIEYGQKLKQENRIKLFTLSKLPATPNLNYEKLGFKKTDENWIQ